MKENKIEIAKIVIKIAGKELALSLEEAKDLRSILNETFGNDERVTHHPWIVPCWVGGTQPVKYGTLDVQCSATSGMSIGSGTAS